MNDEQHKLDDKQRELRGGLALLVAGSVILAAVVSIGRALIG